MRIGNSMRLNAIILFVAMGAVCSAQISANFTYTVDCDRVVTFSNISSGNASFSWTFGDSFTSNNSDPVHTYATGGIYTVTLTVSDGMITLTKTKDVVVYDPPAPNINGATSVCVNTQEIYWTSQVPGNTYEWLVEGGTLLNGQSSDSIMVDWHGTGAGFVQVIETNPLGCRDTSAVAVTINPIPTPHLYFPPPDSFQQQSGVICEGAIAGYSLYPYDENSLMPGSTYDWEVTGGNIINGQNTDSITVEWTTPGNGSIQIIETSAAGCIDSFTYDMFVTEAPEANFSASNACFGQEVDFTNLSPGIFGTDYNVISWDFGDGTYSNAQNPSHLYTSPGTYTVTLTIGWDPFSTGAIGPACYGEISMDITIDPLPGPEIICPSIVCAGDEATYTTPAISGAGYNWSVTGGVITDGGGSSDNDVTIVWGNGPTGTISLQITGTPGLCTMPSVIEIPIVPPNPGITGATTVCGSSYQNYSTPAIPGASYNWTVTGGTLSYGQGTNAIGIYWPASGSGTVKVEVVHDLADCFGEDSIQVNILNRFNLSGPAWVCANTTESYSVSGNPPASGVAWNWVVTGGNIVSGQGTENITVDWLEGPTGQVGVSTAPGVYCNNSDQLDVQINRPPPPVNLTSPTQVCENATATYIIPSGYYTTWTVNGGTVSSGGQSWGNFITIEWGSSGTGELIIEQEDRSSWPYCSTTNNIPVDILPSAVPNITGSQTVCVDAVTTYSIPSNPNGFYAWSVVGGIIISGLGTNSIDVQWGQGPYGQVTITNTACNTSSEIVVTISNVNAPVIDIEDLTCDGSSATLVVPQKFASYQWNTGSVDSFITITSPGTYTVTVTNAAGCSDIATIEVQPIPALPVPTAYITATVPAVPTPISIIRLTATPGPNYTYVWSTGQTYQAIEVTTAGTYTVTVTNEFGCQDVASIQITSTGTDLICTGGTCTGTNTGTCPGLFPSFTQSVCNPIQFTNTTAGASFYFWVLGNGRYSWDENPEMEYQTANTYNVTLYASTNGSCWSLSTQPVNVQSVMDADFDVIYSCFGTATQFADSSESARPIISWQWDFGDGSTSNLQEPSHLYAAADTYSVTLVIYDGLCYDTVQKDVVILELTANFAVNQPCVGNPVLFTDLSFGVKPIVDWQWDFDDSGTSDDQNPFHFYSAAGSYNPQLIITDVIGCSDTITQPLTINTFDVGNLTGIGPPSFCLGDSVKLIAPNGAGYIYNWSNGATTRSVWIKQPGMFYAKVTDPNGCFDYTDTVTVSVHTPPNASIQGGPLSFCEDDFVALYANPTGSGFTYQWFKDGSFVSANQSIWRGSTSQSGSYFVVVTDNNGCIDTSETVELNIYSKPPWFSVSASGPTTFCEGETVTLSGPAGYSYTWSTGDTSQNITVTASGYYTLTITNANGCTRVDSRWVTVNPLPDLGQVPYGCYDICLSDSIEVHGPSGMTNYLWSSGENSQSILLDAADVYSLTATTSSGCSDSSANLYISVDEFLDVDLGNDTTFCEGGMVLLDPGAGFSTYQWQDASTTQTYIADTTGTYRVMLTDSNGCQGQDSIVITMLLGLNGAAMPDTAICQEAEVQLLATGGSSYSWFPASGLSCGTCPDPVATIQQTTTYGVVISDSGACNIDTAYVTVDVFSGQSSIDLGNDTVFCEGESMLLNAGAGFASYEWQGGITGQTLQVDTAGVYWVLATDSNGCSVQDSIIISMLPGLNGEAMPDTVICLGSDVQLLAQGGSNYTWFPAAGLSCNDCPNPTATVEQTTTYGVEIAASGACNIDTAYVTVTVNAVPDPGLDSVINVAQGSEITLTANGGSTYNWSPDNTGCDDCQEITVSPLETTTYSVEVTDSNGCTAWDEVTVEVFYDCEGSFNIPTAFSPNDDGFNDLFKILHTGDSRLVDFKIFNRWGEIVFETSNPEEGWNGVYKGEEQDLDVFAYYVRMYCQGKLKTIVGNVTLVR